MLIIKVIEMEEIDKKMLKIAVEQVFDVTPSKDYLSHCISYGQQCENQEVWSSPTVVDGKISFKINLLDFAKLSAKYGNTRLPVINFSRLEFSGYNLQEITRIYKFYESMQSKDTDVQLPIEVVQILAKSEVDEYLLRVDASGCDIQVGDNISIYITECYAHALSRLLPKPKEI